MTSTVHVSWLGAAVLALAGCGDMQEKTIEQKLTESVKAGDLETVRKTLPIRQAAGYTTRANRYLLDEAIETSNTGMLQVLLGGGVVPTFDNLVTAIDKHDVNAVRAVVGANVHGFSLHQDGDRALKNAAYSGNVEMVQILLEAGNGINPAVDYSHTIKFAEQADHTEIAHLLRAAVLEAKQTQLRVLKAEIRALSAAEATPAP